MTSLGHSELIKDCLLLINSNKAIVFQFCGILKYRPVTVCDSYNKLYYKCHLKNNMNENIAISVLVLSACWRRLKPNILQTWWRYDMDTLFPLLALYEVNTPMKSEFPAQSTSNALMFPLRSARRSCWTNRRIAGDVRRNGAQFTSLYWFDLCLT